MAKIKTGDRIQVHYSGTLDDGKVFDSSQGHSPLEFVVGENALLKDFEAAVIGLEPGERTQTRIPAGQAYGPRRPELVFEVERKIFPQDITPEIGQPLTLNSKDGRSLNVVVTAVGEAKVTLDANHPLSGQDLTFAIEVVAILPSSQA